MSAITAARPLRTHSQPVPRPRWQRPALAALLSLTALLYLVGLSRNAWGNDFYAAAVQAGTKSWKAFFFGSFDSASFITVDKTPASLWVMELSARVFGLNYWSMLVPQALEGVASVAALYAAVRRWFGPAAGLLAGLVLALTPVAALMFRYNNPDALLTLLLAAAAYATVRAVESGRTRWLVLAGSLLGFGFLAKMLQAFLVLPALGVAYLACAPRSAGIARRIIQLLAGLAAMIVSAGWWIAVVLLTPAADRPYVGGSTSDNILQLTFGYNGLGRLAGNETGSVGFHRGTIAGGLAGAGGPGGGGGGPNFSGAAGIGRLFDADLGGQISWLLPAALLAIAALGWLAWRNRASRRPWAGGQAGAPDRTMPALLIWGGWLLVTGGVFSYMAGIIHPYYSVALAPAIGALAGIGAVRLWQERASWPARSLLAAGVLITAWWSDRLLSRSPSWQPWLRPAVLAAGLIAAAAIVVVPWLAGRSPGGRPGLRQVMAATGIVAICAALAGPLAYTLSTVRSAHTGALPSAGPAVTTGFGGGSGFGGPGGGGSSGSTGQPGGAGFPGGLPGGSTGSTGSTGSGGTGRLPGSGGLGGTGGLGRSGGPGGLAGSTTVSSALVSLLTKDASSYTWAAATVGSESAAPLQLATGDAIMAIGGFNGTDPWPTLSHFKKLVAQRKVHYFVGTNADSFGGGSGDAAAITSWVSSHFAKRTVGGETVYDLTTPKT